MTTKRRWRRWRRLAAAVGLAMGLWGSVAAIATVARAEFRCAVCGRLGDEGEQVFSVPDPVTQKARAVCAQCKGLKTICFVCAIPIPENARELGDGRFLCVRDAQTAVVDGAEAKRAAAESRAAAVRTHARFIALPAQGVEFVLEDQKEMGRALGRGPRVCAYPYLRVSSEKKGSGWQHEVGLLSGQPRSWLSLESAHALAHVWLQENQPEARQAVPAAVEAFCDLVAWRAAEELGLAAERPRLERSKITDDQFQLFLEADRTFDFNAVQEWMRYGQDARLTAGEHDRVRVLDDRLRPARRTEIAPPPVTDRAEPPDRLSLNGVVGSGSKRLALVNDATLAAGEKGRIRLSDGVMEVECLEIKTNSVVLRVVATGQEVELKLKQPQPTVKE